jgi:hypothetical protein
MKRDLLCLLSIPACVVGAWVGSWVAVSVTLMGGL